MTGSFQCRLCRAEKSVLQSIYDGTLVDAIRETVQIEVNAGFEVDAAKTGITLTYFKQVPKASCSLCAFICVRCNVRVLEFLEFKLACLESEAHFKRVSLNGISPYLAITTAVVVHTWLHIIIVLIVCIYRFTARGSVTSER